MKTYETPELIEYGTVENLTAGDGNQGWDDLLAWAFHLEPDPRGTNSSGS